MIVKARKTVKWLFENGCDINERNECYETSLMVAAANGHLETVKWLVERFVKWKMKLVLIQAY